MAMQAECNILCHYITILGNRVPAAGPTAKQKKNIDDWWETKECNKRIKIQWTFRKAKSLRSMFDGKHASRNSMSKKRVQISKNIDDWSTYHSDTRRLRIYLCLIFAFMQSSQFIIEFWTIFFLWILDFRMNCLPYFVAVQFCAGAQN